MANFDSGVRSYIFGIYTIKIGFPVDFSGVADISCERCKLFNRNSGKCVLTGEIAEYPKKYVGSHCPLEIMQNEEVENLRNQRKERRD